MAKALRLIARLLTALIFTSVAGVVAFLVFVLTPPKNSPDSADVVLVIAGADDGRHELAAELVTAGVADNLVVSNPSGPRDPTGYGLCHGEGLPPDTHTWCLHPVPKTTTGEAQTFHALARQEGWESAVLTTSRLHHRRVAFNFHQCTDVHVEIVNVQELHPDWLARQLAREAGGFLKFLVTLPC